MDDVPTDDLFAQLRSADPQQAWARFLDHYSPLLFDVIHLFEREPDAVGDCYVFICERLSRNRFRRLLRFRRDGPARFSTWLCAVARHLCLDWHREQCGRHRVFDAIIRLGRLEREIFRCVYFKHLPPEETFCELQPRFRELTSARFDEALARVHGALTSRQRWLLAVRRTRGVAGPALSGDVEDGAASQIASGGADPETLVALREECEVLARVVVRLAAPDRLLLRLRFEQGLTLDEIAQLLRLGNAQNADRRIREVVGKLRAMLGLSGRKEAGSVRVME